MLGEEDLDLEFEQQRINTLPYWQKEVKVPVHYYGRYAARLPVYSLKQLPRGVPLPMDFNVVTEHSSSSQANPGFPRLRSKTDRCAKIMHISGLYENPVRFKRAVWTICKTKPPRIAVDNSTRLALPPPPLPRPLSGAPFITSQRLQHIFAYTYF